MSYRLVKINCIKSKRRSVINMSITRTNHDKLTVTNEYNDIGELLNGDIFNRKSG